MPDDILTAPEAARLLGRPLRTIQEACVRGDLIASRFGQRGWLIRRRDALAWVPPRRGPKPKETK